jgi:hypothetical protein
MGRLIPVFEEKPGRGRLFEGKFKDEESGRVGYLEIGSSNSNFPEIVTTLPHFVSGPAEREN